jgi:hypothetical protein
MQINAIMTPDAATGNSEKLAAMDKDAFASRYDVSRRTCDNWIQKGLPILKLSQRQVRIPLPDADTWVREKFFQQRRSA